MSQALCFNEFTFSPVQHSEQPWIPARQLANALGYKDERSVHKIYERNKEEFSSMMSVVVNLTTGVAQLPTRIFSLRGCHLLAMFARTPVAKAFRRWCLDVIEQYGDRVPVERPVDLSDSVITPGQQAQLHALVDAKAGMMPKAERARAYAQIWTRFNRHFQVARYQQLPASRMVEAIDYLVDLRLDELREAMPALPAAPRFDEAAMLELAAEIREAQQHYYRTFGRLCSRLISMSIPVFTALESRVYKQAPDRPFSGVRIGAQWERYFTERMTAALHSLDDRLPDEKNPAMLLLEYARAMSAR
jgi:hypothetical protein